MSKTTTHFDLIKPELTDVADITATNVNWDKIDTELHNLNGGLGDLSNDLGDLSDLLEVVDNRHSKFNLLVNTDFKNPVNSKGATTYDVPYTVCIDKWVLGHGSSRIVLQSDGIKLDAANDDLLSYISQRFALKAGTYTAVAKFKDNTGRVAITSYSSDKGNAPIGSSEQSEGIITHTFTLIEDLDESECFIRLQTDDTPTTEVVWEWAALYEGEYTVETLPPYIPKGCGVEAANCIGGSLTIKKLWENALPTSSFSAQTIALDLSGYDMVIIKSKAQADSTSLTRLISMGFIGENIPTVGYLNLSSSSSIESAYRLAEVTTAGIKFATGYAKRISSSSDSAESKTNRCIPIDIYGVKGVHS